MPIEIKKSRNPVKYEDAISIMEDRLKDIDQKKVDDFIRIIYQYITSRTPLSGKFIIAKG